MKKATKILALLMCAVLLVVASVAGTLAYLTSQDKAVNNFTVGKVQITLDEAPVNDDGEPLRDQDRVQSNDYHLLPGHYYSKDPMVHVVADSEDCYVRMFVTITHSEEWDDICDAHVDDNGNRLFGADDMFVGLSPAWTLNNNTKNIAAGNTRTYEFWYNTKVTDVSETEDMDLDALFDGIQIPDALTNEDLAKLEDDAATAADEGFKIYIVAQAIQADGFADAAAAFGAAPAITGAALMPTV